MLVQYQTLAHRMTVFPLLPSLTFIEEGESCEDLFLLNTIVSFPENDKEEDSYYEKK